MKSMDNRLGRLREPKRFVLHVAGARGTAVSGSSPTTECGASPVIALGIASLVRPQRVKAFLGALASTPRVHFTELAIRALVGCAFVLTAPRMPFAPAFTVFGWVLVGTTLLLALIPWHLHRRFANWSVPQATRVMPLFGMGALAGGIVLLGALLLQRAAG